MLPDAGAFFRQAKTLRLSAQEFQAIRSRILERTPDSVLGAPEKSDIFFTLRYFTRAFPARSVPSNDHASSIFTFWQGANLFRHLQPFVV